MTAEELRSDNRFLIDQLKEALEENRRLKEDISEIKQDLKESNRRADEEAAGRKRLFDKLIYTPGRIKDARNDEYTNGIYNTFISTCVQQCRNFRDFFVDYVKAWNQGRRDFGNLIKLAFAPCA